ncbi:type II/IV secretion system protein [Candidatus Peregrinibacteria bacterium]|nr:type II/IV secretion system protein [Candidatus Peregrinibacteria bacterium]
MKIDQKKLIKGLTFHKVDPNDIKSMIEQSTTTKTPLYDIVAKKHVLSDEELGRLVAEIIEYPFVNLTKVEIPNEILELIPENIALKQGFITFGIDDEKNTIKVATIDPFDIEMINDIKNKTGREAEVYYTTLNNIKNIIGKYHQELKNIFLDMIPSHLRYGQKDKLIKDTTQNEEITEEEIPIVKIFDAILLHAYRHHASDIHIETTKNNTVIRYRMDGVLHKVVEYPKEIHDPLLTRCKILAGLRIDETRAAQDGRISLKLDGDNVAFRVSILPTHFGEKVVMRLLVDLEESTSLSECGLSDKSYKTIITNSTKPYGMMIVVGPTGSGKTTTLYNIIKLLNSEEINIATIEDPIEYGIDGINQVQVNHATNLTFANGLRALLRQDPDSILVGEIRDQDTAQIAIESSMTGHMVFSTLHANSTAVGIPRLIEMGIEPFLLTAAINCLVAQRLVRRLCTNCIQSHVYTSETLSLIHKERNIVELINKIYARNYSKEELEELDIKNEYILYKSKGCKSCGFTGYKGRIGLYEIMELDDQIKTAILEGKSSDDIEDVAVNNGMTIMLEDGIEKALSGITSLEEIIRVIKA